MSAAATFDETIALHERVKDGRSAAGRRRGGGASSTSLQRGGKLLVFGNGGSAADAQHVAAELVGRFQRERRGAGGGGADDRYERADRASRNDYGFERVFARQVEALGRAGDVALGISTSGASPNVVAALEAARGAGTADDRADRRATAARWAGRPTIHINVPSPIRRRGCRKCIGRCCT